MTESIPARIGKYIVESVLGQGAMGVVYKGLDPHIERQVAIKVIRKAAFDDEELAGALVRFQREAQAAGRLMHPNVVTVYEYGEEGNTAFIAMEYVEGRTFKEIFADDQRLPLAQIGDLFNQLLLGLGYAHEFGVVHRDIKPANIVLDGRGQVKIMDFGIARVESSSLTMAGTVVGTPAYMAPELISGLKVDRRCDLFAAGVILYQLLTGEKPFVGESMTAIMHKVVNMEPMAPSLLVQGLPSQLDEVIAKALAKDPDERYQTAEEFSKEFTAAVAAIPPSSGFAKEDGSDDATVCLAPPVEKQAGPGGKSWLWVTIIVVIALAVLVFFIWGRAGLDEKSAKEVSPVASQPEAGRVAVPPVADEGVAAPGRAESQASEKSGPEVAVEQQSSPPVRASGGQPAAHNIKPRQDVPSDHPSVAPRLSSPAGSEATADSVADKPDSVTFIPDSLTDNGRSPVSAAPDSAPLVPISTPAPAPAPAPASTPTPTSSPASTSAQSNPGDTPELGSTLPGTAPFKQMPGGAPGRLLREDEW